MKRIKTFIGMLIVALMVSAVIYTTDVYAAGSKVTTKQYTISKKPGVYNEEFIVKIKAVKGYNVYYTTSDKTSVKKVVKSGKSKSISISKFTVLKVYAAKNTVKITNKKLKNYYDHSSFKSYTYAISRFPSFADVYGKGTIKQAISEATANERREFYADDTIPLFLSVPMYYEEFKNSDGTIDVFGKFYLCGLKVDGNKYVVSSLGIEVGKVTLKKNDNGYDVISIVWPTDGASNDTSLAAICKDHSGLADKLTKSAQKVSEQKNGLIKGLKTYNKNNGIKDITKIKFVDESKTRKIK